MGGKAMALVGVETERKNTEDHLRIQFEMAPRIAKLFNTEVKAVTFFRNKETHGDLDLLILNDGNLGNVAEILRKEFGPVHNNGNVFSFEYDKYQIDIIPQPVRNWETAQTFFDWDPTGNLMGKIAHKFGLKYGFQGLVYPFRSFSGRLSKDIRISNNNREIFEFLGFDYDTYLKGFDSVEEIFEYVIGSKYFNSDNFLMHNLNAIDRKRNKKRKTYQEFLTYVNDSEAVNNFEFKKKSEYIEIINSAFPDVKFIEQLDEIKRKDELAELASQLFNGHMVMEITGLEGKALGGIISDFKEFKKKQTGLSWSESVVNDMDIRETFEQWYHLNK